MSTNPNFRVYWEFWTDPPILETDPGLFVSPCICCTHPIYRNSNAPQLVCENEDCQEYLSGVEVTHYQPLSLIRA